MHQAMALIAVPLLLARPVLAAEMVTVGKDDCHRIVIHRPDPNVEYRPGVDVSGRAVAPADLPDSATIATPKTITIGIAIELDERLGLGKDGRYKGTAPIGVVTVTEGRLYYDGQLLADRDQAAIAAACREMLERTP